MSQTFHIEKAVNCTIGGDAEDAKADLICKEQLDKMAEKIEDLVASPTQVLDEQEVMEEGAAPMEEEYARAFPMLSNQFVHRHLCWCTNQYPSVCRTCGGVITY